MSKPSFTRRLFYPYLVLLFWLPIPLGSNRPLWSSLAALVAGLLLLFWVLGRGLGYTHIPRPLQQAHGPLLILAMFNLWMILQLLPAGLVPDFLQSPSIRQAYLAASGGVAWLSADWYASSEALLQSLGLLFMALLTVLLVITERRVQQLLAVLMLAGLAQALYGSLMTLTGAEYGFLEAKEIGRGLASGTYINRNHYANMLVMALSAGIALLICKLELRGATSWRARVISFFQSLLGEKARIRVYLAIMVVALVMTHSRMGNTSFFVALLVASVVSLVLMQRLNRPLLVLMVSLLVIDIFLMGTWFGLDQVIERIQNTVQLEQDNWVVNATGRIDANRETLKIIEQAPLLGTGGGTFYTVYPRWRTGDQKFMDHAHNDYLQFTAEYGLPGALLLAAFLILVIRQVMHQLRRPDQTMAFVAAFASSIAITAMLIHIAVEFNLQIYANAAWFVALCMLPFCRLNAQTAAPSINPQKSNF